MSFAPIDYRTGVRFPIEAAMTAYQLGEQSREKARLRSQKDIAQFQQAMAQQKAAEQQAQMNQEIQSLYTNPENITPENVSQMMNKYPQLKGLEKLYETANEQQKINRSGQLGSVIAAIDSGNIDIAKQQIQKEIEALENSGKNAVRQRNLLKLMDNSPGAVKFALTTEQNAIWGGKPADVIKEQTAREKLTLEEKQISLAEERFKYEQGKKIGDLTQDARKEALRLTGQGYKPINKLSVDEINSLPESAFVTVGLGDNTITLKKPPVKLTGEGASKLAIIQKGTKNYTQILNDIEKGKFKPSDIRLAATKAVKNLPRLQPIKNQLGLMVEGLARNLSGAAIGDEELERFRDLFSIKSFDSDDEIKNKLKRAIDIAKRVEQMVLYGATPDEQAELIRNEIGGDTNTIEQNVPMKGATGVMETPGVFDGVQLPFYEGMQ